MSSGKIYTLDDDAELAAILAEQPADRVITIVSSAAGDEKVAKTMKYATDEGCMSARLSSKTFDKVMAACGHKATTALSAVIECGKLAKFL